MLTYFNKEGLDSSQWQISKKELGRPKYLLILVHYGSNKKDTSEKDLHVSLNYFLKTLDGHFRKTIL